MIGAPANAPLLEVRDLSVAFGTPERPLPAVEGVGFDLPAGGALGLVGESGSGKSVTALSILRLIASPGRITGGCIRFQGTDLLALPEAALPEIRGRDIAMVFQEPMSSLNPLMTIGDQVEEAILLHQELSRADRRARAVELLRLVGIPDPASRLAAYPHEFSGGMRQRVMIAMALACTPKLLIADEPTTALDVTIQAQVLALIARLREATGTALLLISHDLGVIAEMCDRVVVLYAGRIVEQGAVRAIFHRAAHPYTQGLLEAVPRLDDDRARLAQIPGSVPMPGQAGPGCPFVMRCTRALPRCAEEMPPLVALDGDHRAACWVTAPP
ncbi:ABC transporter ATP-binding protein [Roseomonas sp. CAU 1739]|uniref:ABC transporter ATP-binding protein n=1 Tax=Roseomonas sp. CAU 1739 TaxID=3140364 RepID=UPI00325C206A